MHSIPQPKKDVLKVEIVNPFICLPAYQSDHTKTTGWILTTLKTKIELWYKEELSSSSLENG